MDKYKGNQLHYPKNRDLFIHRLNNWSRTLGTRDFSRLRREFSVLAEGRSHERRSREKNSAFRAGHYKDLIETVNLARKVSGTQGTEAGAGLR